MIISFTLSLGRVKKEEEKKVVAADGNVESSWLESSKSTKFDLFSHISYSTDSHKGETFISEIVSKPYLEIEYYSSGIGITNQLLLQIGNWLITWAPGS